MLDARDQNAQPPIRCAAVGANEAHFFIEYLPHVSDMSEIDTSQPIEMPMAFIFMEAGGTSTQAVLTASGKVNAVHWYRVVPAVEDRRGKRLAISEPMSGVVDTRQRC